MTLQITPTSDTTLARTAVAINAAHARCEAAARDSITHAIEAGRLLAEVKSNLPHGEWLPWLKKNFSSDAKTATTYIRLFTNRDAIANRERAADLTNLTVRGAIKAITPPTVSPLRVKAAENIEQTDEIEIGPTIPSPIESSVGNPVDAVGHEIKDKGLQEVFACIPKFRSLNTRISKLKKEFEEDLVKSVAGVYASRYTKQFDAAISTAHRIIRFVIPYALCPYCGGRKCDGCKRTGWMPEAVYKVVPPEHKTEVSVNVT